MPYKKIKSLLKNLFKNKPETPELPITIITEFTTDFEKETDHLKTFLSVYNKSKMRAKIEKRMQLFEGTHDKDWKEVQIVANAMITLAKTAKKSWTTKKQSSMGEKTKTNRQIYNILFHTLSKRNKVAIRRIAEKGEIACEHGVKLQRRYLFHVTDKRIKKSFEKALVDAYKIWEEFTDAIKEEKYKVIS
jgi:hypothetical protein